MPLHCFFRDWTATGTSRFRPSTAPLRPVAERKQSHCSFCPSSSTSCGCSSAPMLSVVFFWVRPVRPNEKVTLRSISKSPSTRCKLVYNSWLSWFIINGSAGVEVDIRIDIVHGVINQLSWLGQPWCHQFWWHNCWGKMMIIGETDAI